MPPHPHQQWPSKYPPSPQPPTPPKPLYASNPHLLSSSRLYARTPALLIRTHHLPPQSQLNERELSLQEYLGAERATRGNGSPVEGARNVQQVWSFGATDRRPGNVVGDDGWVGGFGDGEGEEWDGERELGERVQGRGGRGMRVVNGGGDEDGNSESRYRRRGVVVDRKHRSLVQSLVGPPPPPHPRPRRRSGGVGGVDVKALRQVERNLSALGF